MTTTVSASPAAILTRLDEARALIQRFAEMGAVPDQVETMSSGRPNPQNFVDGDLRFSFYGTGDYCERAAVSLLEAFPAAQIERDASRRCFTMWCPGRPSWGAYFSQSACTRVQTGTRTTTIPDPVAMESVPLVEVEEPVYEWRCADQLAQVTS